MTNLEVNSNKNIDYKDQYDKRTNITNTDIRLAYTANQLLKQLGNDIILSGLDIKTLQYDEINNLLNIEITAGKLIQDCVYIEIENDIILYVDATGFDFLNGEILLYTDYKFDQDDFENIDLKIYANYINFTQTNSIWDHERNRIVISGIFKNNELGTFEISNKSVYNINGKNYSYKGISMYSLSGIHNDYSYYLDLFDKIDIRDFVINKREPNEYFLNILSNDFKIIEKMFFYGLFIDYVFLENDSSSLYYNYFIKQLNQISYRIIDNNIHITNNTDLDKDIVLCLFNPFVFDVKEIDLLPQVGNVSFDINTLFDNQSCFAISTQVYKLNGNELQSVYNICDVVKENSIITIRNKTDQQQQLILQMAVVDYYENNQIQANSFIDFNIDYIFNNKEYSIYGLYVDLYYSMDNYIFNKFDDNITIIKFESYIRIYNNLDDDIFINILISPTSVKFTEYNRCLKNNAFVTPISINKIGTGNGIISSEIHQGDCSEEFYLETQKHKEISFIAEPNTDSVFSKWIGCDYVENNTCFVKPTCHQNLTVVFNKQVTLTINIIGDGNVFSSPIGLDETTNTCSFDYGTTIKLLAKPTNSANIVWDNAETNNIRTISELKDDMTISVEFSNVEFQDE